MKIKQQEKVVISHLKKEDVYVLATDLDGTFLESNDRQKDALYALLKDNPNILLVYVTGRNTELILPLLDDAFIPSPDYIIGDVGATVIDGETLEPVEPLQHDISAHWNRTIKDIASVDEIELLTRQDQPQERRMSFYVDPDKQEDMDKMEHVYEQLQGRDCDVLYSNEIYLDILPKGVNKGTTLRALIDHLGISHDRVLTAGDTLNDASMLLDAGYKSVVLNNAEEPLKKAARLKVEETPEVKDLVHFAKRNGTEGILEALEKFSMIMRDSADDVVTVPKYGDADLVMVYHRMPYREVKDNGKTTRAKHTSPNGILPTLLGFFSEKQKGSWIAWSLEDTRSPENFQEHVDVDKEKYENLKACRIPLTAKDVEVFYEVFSKEAFWLLLHSFHERAIFNHDHWDHFLEINEIFAKKAAQEAAKGATVWIHDYNLWMVPEYLRQLRPDVKIAFYHHTPFPASDIFNMLPWRREIINSLLQCDYVGFHIPQYVENFVDVVRSSHNVEINERENAAPRFKTYGCAIGVDRYVTSLTTELNTVELGAHPVGINCNYIKELVDTPKVNALYDKIKAENEGRKLIVSIERTDYTKGPVEKLKAYEKFLADNPDLHGEVSLIMVCTPPAKGMKIYEEISQDIAYHVGLINGRFGRYDWTPIHFVSRMVPFEDVIAYYSAADVGWVTPLRDGLNLVAKEYVMAKAASKTSGALVLSEFAGAAAELHGAFPVNPYDIRDMADTLKLALHASEEDKASRMRRMANIIQKYDVNEWGRDFIESVEKAGSDNPTMLKTVA